MKKYVLAVLAVCVFTLCPKSGAQGGGFMQGFEDLPLMDGLRQSADSSVSFDAPSGRIIEVYAESDKVGKNSIFEFYDKTLPQLGWKRAPKGVGGSSVSYLREGEELTIYVEAGASVVVRFELTTK